MNHYYFVLDMGRFHAETQEDAYGAALEYVLQCLPDGLTRDGVGEMLTLQTSGPCPHSCDERDIWESL